MNQYFEENKNIKSHINKIQVNINNISYFFYTDNGLFNKKGLDLGTKILLENYDFSNKNSFLDMGCGCGPIGLYLALLDEKNKIDMVDINNNAIKLVKKSLKENNIENACVFKSDGYEKIKNNYDSVLLNPPIHAGKKVIYKIITDTYNYLNEFGELWVVIRKSHGAKSLINDFKEIYDYEVICKDHGFWIIKFIKK